MNPAQLESLYGPLYRFGDHKIGEVIRFYDVVIKKESSGTILWVKGPDIQRGRRMPVTYILDTPDPSTGFPYEVGVGEVVE